MASFLWAFILAAMLPSSFTQEASAEVRPIEKLVDYEYDLNFSAIIPGVAYNRTLAVRWAVPDAALEGLDGRSLKLKVMAEIENSTAVYFLVGGKPSNYTEAFLRCDVANSTCANSSILYAAVPIFVKAQPEALESPKIRLRSEIEEGGLADGLGFIGEFEKIFQGDNSTSEKNKSKGEKNGYVLEIKGENLLENFKPEGSPTNVLEFFKSNAAVSLVALVVVIIITGAYLLKTKD
ncbi:MAG: hypothetical protein N3G22_01275 [Candidatus Micrarchaeota archaeon]|nr:hypothetical protein [Candidatus Micrarchaeota archaeon]